MEGLTKEEAVRRHRMLWNYIADESEKRGYPISKTEAISALWPDLPVDVPIGDCWACEYSINCISCIIKWPGGYCGNTEKTIGLYSEWRRAYLRRNIEMVIKLAKEIANLPEV